MDMINPLIRQLKIDMITDAYNPIIEWFNSIWNDLYVTETSVYHNNGGELIYFILNNDVKKIIFYQDDSNENFWCHYDNYWSILESKHKLNYKDIQSINKFIVENGLNNSIGTSIHKIGKNYLTINNALNNNEANNEAKSIPIPSGSFGNNRINHCLNNNVDNNVIRPIVVDISTELKVEDALNKKTL